MDALGTADIYELVERHRAASTLVTFNREPIEWIGQMPDALLAQSAIDWCSPSAVYELIWLFGSEWGVGPVAEVAGGSAGA